ncbi:uncharacterized protein LOC120335119 [Styela clava]
MSKLAGNAEVDLEKFNIISICDHEYETDMEDVAWKIFSGVKDASRSERRNYRDRMKFITTSSEFQSQEDAVSELKSLISNNSSLEGHISTMILAYKDGTQIVEETFTFQPLSDLLRESIMIVAIDETSNLSDDLAKISVNLRAQSDITRMQEEYKVIGDRGKQALEVSFGVKEEKPWTHNVLSSISSSSTTSLNVISFMLKTGASAFILSLLGIKLPI